MAQGLPLRPEAFDGAVSISAVQWLCVHSRPEGAAAQFMGALWQSLVPGARAALQVYVRGKQSTPRA